MPSPGVFNQELAGVRLGSLWTESMSPDARPVVDALMDVSTMTQVYRQFENTRLLMEGQTNQTLEKLTVEINPQQVAQLGGDLQLRLLENAGTSSVPIYITTRPLSYSNPIPDNTIADESSYQLQAEDGFYLVYPQIDEVTLELTSTDLYPRYVVPFPDDIIPQTILANRELVNGLDFVMGGGCIIFWESPDVLFPQNRMLVRTAYQKHRAIFSYTLQLDNLFTPGYYVAKYLRDTQSAYSLQLAVAEVAGAVIIPWTSALRQILQVSGGVQYTFDDGMLFVPYAHTPLTLENTYPAGTIIGNVVQVIGADQTTSWYRQVSWSNGLSLDGLCPFAGLSLSDATAKAVAVTGGVGFPINGDSAVISQFWSYVAAQSTATGYAISNVLSLGDAVNPIDFVFQYIWNERALLIHLDPALGSDAVTQAQEFISREKPIGSVIIYTP